MSTAGNDIAVIIVFFNPTAKDIANAGAIAARYRGVITDNSPVRNFAGDSVGKMLYLPHMRNIGIAEAQNKAIEALGGEYEYIVFLDQDSRTDTDYPQRITDEYILARQQFPNLATLGPTLINEREGAAYSSVIHKDNFVSPSLILQPNIISSGSCIARGVLEDVGLNEAGLFIDFVDSEWCWRANAKGYICATTAGLSMKHSIGKRLLKLGPYLDIISSPVRYYYQTRNYLWLIRRGYVPLRWKIANGIKDFLRLFYVPFFAGDGLKACRYMWRGIADGIMKSSKKQHKGI